MTMIQANRYYKANDPAKAYRIRTGSADVFVRSIVDGGEVLRTILCKDVPDGFTVPGCCFGREFLGQNCTIEFLLLARTDLEIEEPECTEEIREQFCREFFPECAPDSSFEDLVFNWLLKLRDEKRKAIEGAKAASSSAESRTIDSFVSIFSEGDSVRSYKTAPTASMLYDAAARLCNWMLIDIAPFLDIYDSSEDRIRVEDIARISGFVTRDIILEPGWERKDLGPLLVYMGEAQLPCVLLPKSGGRGYEIWRSDVHEKTALTGKIAAEVTPRAVMFYKSFPHKSMGLKDLLKFAAEYLKGGDVLSIFLLILLETLIGILIPTMNEKLYDLFIPLGDASGLLGMCCVIIACTLGNVAFGLVKGFTNFSCFNRIKYGVQAAAFDRLFNMPCSFIREYDSAVLAEKAFGAGNIVDLLSKSLFLTGFSTIFSFLYLHKMNKYSKKMTKTAVIALLICMAVILLLGLIRMKYEEKKRESSNRQSSILYQLISAIDKLRIAGAEQRGLARYFGIYKETALTERSISGIGTWNTILNGAMSVVSSMIFYYLMIRKDMDLSMGNFMAFTSAFGAFSAAMLQLVSSVLDLTAIKPDYKELKPILETVPEIDTAAALPGEITGRIEVNNVSFAYEADHYILQDFSLKIGSGEYVGVVGSSGCGKSTLLKLLLGFETPQQGKVFYDDKDIETVNKRELRKQFGVVLQNGDTISGSIYDNITITDPTVSMDDVKQAVKDAGLEEDIAQMPMGLHTVLSEGGGGVSGGQKQRILIARAIVSKPKVLFFDEATSALDNRTQQQICESIEKLDCTKFIIAHRLSTIMNCDRIIVMDAGRIVEEGTYEELMAKEGLFYQLARRQMA